MMQDWKKLGKKGQGVQGRPEMVTKSKQVFVRLCSTSHGQPSMIAVTGQSSNCNKRWFHNNQIFWRIRWEGLPFTGTSTYRAETILMTHSTNRINMRRRELLLQTLLFSQPIPAQPKSDCLIMDGTGIIGTLQTQMLCIWLGVVLYPSISNGAKGKENKINESLREAALTAIVCLGNYNLSF